MRRGGRTIARTRVFPRLAGEISCWVSRKHPQDWGRGGPIGRPVPGQVMIMLALLMPALIGMMGLAVDVGFLYAQRRTVQNAADAAALAGARAVANWSTTNNISALPEVNLMAGVTPDGGEYRNSIGRPNADSDPDTRQEVVACDYVDDAGNPVGACAASVPADATGVRVTVEEEHPTFFIQFLPGVAPTATTAATATARVQRFWPYPSDAPFIVCGTAAWGVKRPDGTSISQSIDIVRDDNTVDPAYIGYTFRVWDPQISTGPSSSERDRAGCGTPGSSWKGLADTGENAGLSAPDWFKIRSGTVAGPTRTATYGAQGCQPPANSNCVMFLPIGTDEGQPRSDDTIRVVTFAAFLVTEVDGNTFHAKLLGDYITAGGGEDGWTQNCACAAVVRMTE